MKNHCDRCWDSPSCKVAYNAMLKGQHNQQHCRVYMPMAHVVIWIRTASIDSYVWMLGLQLVDLFWQWLGGVVLLEKVSPGVDSGVSKDHARQAQAVSVCIALFWSLSLFLCLMPVDRMLLLQCHSASCLWIICYCSSAMPACCCAPHHDGNRLYLEPWAPN